MKTHWILVLFFLTSMYAHAQQKCAGTITVAKPLPFSTLNPEQIEAKKELYRQMNLTWPGSEIESAKKENQDKHLIVVRTETEKKLMLVEYISHKSEWVNSDPEKLAEYEKALTDGNVVVISAEEYKAFSNEKKRVIDSNPSLYRVVENRIYSQEEEKK